jgi:hypothetical protein
MPESVAINTGPLIALARAGALDLAAKLPFDFICPPQVQDELADGADQGHIAVAPP